MGAKYLPFMYILNAVFIMSVYPFFNYIIGKSNTDTIFYILSTLFGGVLLFVSLLMLAQKPLIIVYPIVFTLFALYTVFFTSHFNSYLCDFFDTLQSKRLLPVIFGITILGSIYGGFLIPIITNTFKNPVCFFFIWLFLLVIINIIVLYNRKYRTFNRVLNLNPKDEGIFKNFYETLKLIKNSNFMQITLFAGFIFQILITALNIKSNTIFASTRLFPDTSSLLEFYGRLEGWFAVVAFVIQVFILPKIIPFMGVGALNIIISSFILITFNSLIFGGSSLILVFAVLARFNGSAIYRYIEPTTTNLILNALGPMQKTRIQSISNCFLEQIGPIIGGLIYTIFPLKANLIFFIIAIIYFVFTFMQKGTYTRELIKLIKGQNFALFKNASEGTKRFSQKVIKVLVENITGNDIDKTIISAELLSDILGKRALPIFCMVIPHASNELQAVLLQIFKKIGLKSPSVLEKVIERLEDEDAMVQKEAIFALDTLDDKDEFVFKVAPLINTVNKEVEPFAAVYLLNRESAESFHADSIKLIEERLLSNDSKTTLYALLTLKKPHCEIISALITLLSGYHKTQKEAARVLINLLDISNENYLWKEYLPRIRLYIKSPVRKVRLFIYKVFQRFGELDSGEILNGLSDPYKKIREISQEIIISKGSFDIKLKEFINKSRQSTSPYMCESLLYIEACRGIKDGSCNILDLIYLSLINSAKELEKLVYCEQYFKGYDDFLLFTVMLKDRFQFFRETSINLLELIEGADIISTIKIGLLSKDKRKRANALETLENLKIKGIKKVVKLLELLISDLPNCEKLQLIKGFVNIEPESFEIFINQFLESKDPWERQISILAYNAYKKRV